MPNRGSVLNAANPILNPGDYLESPLNFYTLTMNALSGNLVLAGTQAHQVPSVTWNSQITNGIPQSKCVLVGGTVQIQTSAGAEVAYALTGGPVTGVALTDSGEIIMYNAVGTPVWDSGLFVTVGGAALIGDEHYAPPGGPGGLVSLFLGHLQRIERAVSSPRGPRYGYPHPQENGRVAGG